MWIVKEVLKGILGVLLGIVTFIVGGVSFLILRTRIEAYRIEQAFKAGRSTSGMHITYWSLFGGSSTDLTHHAGFWIWLTVAITLGLWIVYRPKRAPTNSQSSLEEHAL